MAVFFWLYNKGMQSTHAIRNKMLGGNPLELCPLHPTFNTVFSLGDDKKKARHWPGIHL
jgi:hypothetical protein